MLLACAVKVCTCVVVGLISTEKFFVIVSLSKKLYSYCFGLPSCIMGTW